MDRLEHLVVHRLPQYYHWSPLGLTHSESLTRLAKQPETRYSLYYCLDLTNSCGDEEIAELQAILQQLDIETRIVHLNQQLYLMINQEDEHTANCCFKNRGVAIATDI